MGKVVSPQKLTHLVKQLKKQGQQIVLVGGCFDILHPGHVIFLEKAKRAGDYLIVLLESDRKVRELKGSSRPVHSQQMRAKVLAALQPVDFILMLPFMDTEAVYDQLVQKLQPDIIALTEGYANAHHQRRTAKLTGARLKFVTKLVGNHSTSSILNEN